MLDYAMTWHDDGELVDVNLDIAVIPRATFEFTQPGAGHVAIEVVYDDEARRLVAESVQVHSAGRGVTSAGLHSVRVRECIIEAGRQMAHILFAGTQWRPLDDVLTVERVATASAEPLGRERLASRLYEYARLVNFPPLKLISETLDVSQSTASRLMTTARSKGLAN